MGSNRKYVMKLPHLCGKVKLPTWIPICSAITWTSELGTLLSLIFCNRLKGLRCLSKWFNGSLKYAETRSVTMNGEKLVPFMCLAKENSSLENSSLWSSQRALRSFRKGLFLDLLILFLLFCNAVDLNNVQFWHNLVKENSRVPCSTLSSSVGVI